MINTDSGENHSVGRVITLKEVHKDGPVNRGVDVAFRTHLRKAQSVVSEGRGVDSLYHERLLVGTKFSVFKLKSV